MHPVVHKYHKVSYENLLGRNWSLFEFHEPSEGLIRVSPGFHQENMGKSSCGIMIRKPESPQRPINCTNTCRGVCHMVPLLRLLRFVLWLNSGRQNKVLVMGLHFHPSPGPIHYLRVGIQFWS